ncbi:MAG: FecR domain-containing protein [Gemmatimonadota bacterium]
MNEELLFRFILGDVTAAERGAVVRWRDSAPERIDHLRELAAVLALVAGSESRQRRVTRPSAFELIRLAGQRSRLRSIRTVRPWLVAGVAAAIVTVTVGVLIGQHQPVDFALGAGDFVTGPGDDATVGLGDGSVVKLGPDSRLRVAGVRGERSVSFEGRGYFAVNRMPGHPFRVNTAAGTVTTLGTRFELQARSTGLSLVVVEGRVELSAPGEQKTIKSGERSGVRDGRIVPATKVADLTGAVAWVGNLLVFQATPLAEVARQIEDRYHIRLVLADPALAKRPITAWVCDQTIKQTLATICTRVDAACTTSENVVTMSVR